MRYLGLALFAEGPTDHSFLSPLLRRLTQAECRRRSPEPVEVSGVQSLTSRVRSSQQPRVQRIVDAARAAWPQWHVLFVHTDGGGQPARGRAERVDPAVEALRERFDAEGLGVGVVPVRETEAWAMADGDALRQALGVTFPDEHLGVPDNPGQVEGILYPKRAYQRACRRKRRSRGPHPTIYLPRLGESVSLDILDRVPAFQGLRRELVATLRQLRIITVRQDPS